MPKTTEPQDRQRLLEEIQALRTRVSQLEQALAAASFPSASVSMASLPPTSPHPQAYPLGDPAFPYQRMVEELSEALVALSPTHAIRYVNPRFATLLGREPARLLDVNFFDLIAPEDRLRFEEFLNGSPLQHVQVRLIGAEGRRVPVEISPRQWIVNGIRTFLVVIDLTEQQQAQEQLAFQAFLLEQVNEAVIAVDLQFRITFWNGGAERLYGWTAAEALGRSMPELVRSSASESERAAITEHLATSEASTGEATHYRKDGQALRIEWNTHPLRNAAGTLTGYVSIMRDITARRQTQQALQDSERYFQRVFQLSPTAIIISRVADGQILDVNDRFLQLTGYRREEVIGRSAMDLGLWADPAERVDLTTALGKGQAVDHFEAGLRTRAGKLRQVNISAELIGRQGENVILALLEDITERKRVEEQARRHWEQMQKYAADMKRYAAEVRKHADERQQHAIRLESVVRSRTAELDAERARWQGVVEGIADEVWVADAEGKISLINLPEVTAMRLEEFTDKTVAEVYDEVDILYPDGRLRPPEEAPLLRALKGEIVRGEEIMRHRQTGRTRYRQFSAAPTRDASGAITGSVAIVRDITEQKQTQEALRASEERFRTAAQAANIGIWNWNPESGHVVVGGNWRQVFGVPAEVEITFDTWRNALHPEDREATVAALIAAKDAHTEYYAEYRVVCPDGTVRWIVDRGRATYDEQGRAINVAGVNVDITARKAMEESLRQAMDQIRELNERLERRATELEIANRELDSFSYSVSHDLRTPLASIDVFSTTLQDDYGAGLPEKGQRYLSMIRANTQQMDELIASLLSLSRLSRQPIQKQTVDMTMLVRDAVETLQREAQRPGVAIEIQDLGDAVADPVLLKQVWVNLLANALKFTRPRAEARIEIGCQACDGADRVYYVRDNGVGFDSSQADKLFGVFQRLHGEQDYEGTGVGLAIVARIVRRHGGRIWAEGEVDRGATFYFTLS